MARFINHSCAPNCSMSVWIVQGRYRCAIFAAKDIAANTELTFDYSWEPSGDRPPTICHCGTDKCRGFIEVYSQLDTTEVRFRSGQWRPGSEALADVKKMLRDTPEVQGEGLSPEVGLGQFLTGARVKVWQIDNEAYAEADVLVYESSTKLFHLRYLRTKEVATAALGAPDIKYMWLDENQKEAAIGRKVVSLAPTSTVDGPADNGDNGASDSAKKEKSGLRLATLSRDGERDGAGATRMKAPPKVRRVLLLSDHIATYMLETSKVQHVGSNPVAQVIKLLENMFSVSCFIDLSPRPGQTSPRGGKVDTDTHAQVTQVGMFGVTRNVEDAMTAISNAEKEFRLDSSRKAASANQREQQRQGLLVTNDWRMEVVPGAGRKLNTLVRAGPRHAETASFAQLPNPSVSYPERVLPDELDMQGLLCKPCGPAYDDAGESRKALGAGLTTRTFINDHLRGTWTRLRAVGGGDIFTAAMELHSSMIIQRCLSFLTDMVLDRAVALISAATLLTLKCKGHWRSKWVRKVTSMAYCQVHSRDPKDRSISPMLAALQFRTLSAEAAVMRLLKNDLFVPDVTAAASAALVAGGMQTSQGEGKSLVDCATVAAAIAAVALPTWHCFFPELALCAAHLCLPVAVVICNDEVDHTVAPPVAKALLDTARAYSLRLDEVSDAVIFMSMALPDAATSMEKAGNDVKSGWKVGMWRSRVTQDAVDGVISAWVENYRDSGDTVKSPKTSIFLPHDAKIMSRLRTRSPWLANESDPTACADHGAPLRLRTTSSARTLGKGSFAGWVGQELLEEAGIGYVAAAVGMDVSRNGGSVACSFALTPSANDQKFDDKRRRGIFKALDVDAEMKRKLEKLPVPARPELLRELVLLQQLHYTASEGTHALFGVPLALVMDGKPGSKVEEVGGDDDAEKDGSHHARDVGRNPNGMALTDTRIRTGAAVAKTGSSKRKTEVGDEDGLGLLESMLDDDDDDDDDDDGEEDDDEDVGMGGTEAQGGASGVTAAEASQTGQKAIQPSVRTRLTYLLMPASQLFRPLASLVPSSSQPSAARIDANMALALCKDLFSALQHCVLNGIVLGWISPDQCYVSSQGNLVLGGLAGATSVATATPWSSLSATEGNTDDSNDWPDLPFLSYTAPEIVCGGAPSGASTAFVAASLSVYILTGKPLLKAGSDTKKHMQYIYKTVGTPHKEGCLDVYKKLPLIARLGTSVCGPDGSQVEARSRVIKTLSSLVSRSFKLPGLPQKDPSDTPSGVAALLVPSLSLNPAVRPGLYTLSPKTLADAFPDVPSVDGALDPRGHWAAILRAQSQECDTDRGDKKRGHVDLEAARALDSLLTSCVPRNGSSSGGGGGGSGSGSAKRDRPMEEKRGFQKRPRN